MWSIERCRKKLQKTQSSCDKLYKDNTLALATTENGQRIIKRFGAHAAQRGIREGTSVPLARALFSDVHIEEFDPADDCRALFELAAWALKFSPRVALDPQLTILLKQKKLEQLSPLMNGIVLDLTGTERLHQSEEKLIQRIDSALRALGHRARFGTARTLGAAWAVSRFSKSRTSIISDESSIVEQTASLPLSSLRLEETVLSSLKELGLVSISDLLKLSGRALASRFGFSLLERLDQLRGGLPEKLSFISTEKSYARSRQVLTPITQHDAAQEIVKRLLFSLQDDLMADHKAARHFIISFKPILPRHAPVITRELLLNSALKNREQMAQIIQPFIESLRVTSGIEKFSVLALSPQLVSGTQHALPTLAHEADSFSRAEFEFLLNQFVVRLGIDAVRQPAFHQSHIPEDSFSSERYNGATPPEHHRRNFPSFLLKQPEEVQVIALLPDHAPASIQWRHHRLRVTRSLSAERIAETWWRKEISVPQELRTYFKVQDETGRWLWLFRKESTQRWYLQGIWT